jgi:hypothetical protein
MAKFKPAGSKKSKDPASNRGLFACGFILLMAFGLLFLLFYGVIQSGK